MHHICTTNRCGFQQSLFFYTSNRYGKRSNIVHSKPLPDKDLQQEIFG